MGALERLGADDLRAVVEAYLDALAAHREELNLLNVYPVPDGDTGTNMVLTAESVARAVGGARTVPEVCRALSQGSFMGARGSSGVILSQVLRGLAGAIEEAASHDDDGSVDAGLLAEGLARASSAAYGAVMQPVEGTILTVVREAAEAARAHGGAGSSLVEMLEATKEAAGESLARTPETLGVLAEAGVVDAGAKGFVLLLDALLHVVDGRPLPEPEAPGAVRAHAQGEGGASSLRYEVMFLLDADDEKVPGLKERWAAIGDSIAVVGGGGLWNCHVHTGDVGAAVEAGIEAGRPRDIRVTALTGRVEEEAWVRERVGAAGPPET